ncbi:unnamed protein product [marine sediment metagenome]|uniref:Uncharacterized protein n=1 Tax=marine sediment metagenome TaxID=412755 RepID=X1GV69_9ZZZZ
MKNLKKGDIMKFKKLSQREAWIVGVCNGVIIGVAVMALVNLTLG